MSEGELVIDEFELLNCVATGSYSQIWEVREKGGSQALAMKLLLPEAFADRDQIKVLKHESAVAKSLDHPNFVKFHKVVKNRKRAYLVMEYVRAPNLKALIHNDVAAVHVRISKLFESICLALGYMHDQGWVHKDIKPDNILFSKGSELRIIDFSLSTRVAGSLAKVIGKKKVSSIQGTRTYIAPETIRKRRASPQTDMYSLGVTMFEVLTGQPPFSGTSPSELLKKHVGVTPPEPSEFNPNVTPEMDRLVMRMLAKKPAQRFADMNELNAEFRSVKVFKEDAKEYADQLALKAKDAFEDSLANQLNSRSDAERGGIKQISQTKPKPKTPKPAEPPAATTQANAPQQPIAQPQPAVNQQPMMPPQQPMLPPQPMAYPQPFVAPPAQQPMYVPQPTAGMPGVPPQMAAPPAQPPVQQGGVPPVQQPTPTMPNPPPSQTPVTNRPQPTPKQPAAASQPQKKASAKRPLAHPSQSENDDEIPLMDMDELPDVL